MHVPIKYRPDIDGLRALAILLVLIYHGGLSLFPSGFVGVDIFFVISGFLITNIIHELLIHERFSFIDFYKGRLWRLQPVLICFIFTSIIITLLFFLPDDLLQFSRSARKTVLFISNSFFKQTTTGYFSPDVHQLPLLHTWSLSIEWQCYLILPFILYGLFKTFGKTKMSYVVYILTLICGSFTLYYSKSLPVETYYQVTSRLFEFLIGSSLSLTSCRVRSINSYILNGLGAGALVTILYIAHLPSILIGYPNGYAIGVCLATAVLIGLGRFYPKEMVIQLLSFGPLVFIGVLSYSLYLWHWLIFSVLRYQNVQETAYNLILAYSGTFIIAFCSWKYIEKPARRMKNTNFQNTVLKLLVLPVLVIYSVDQVLLINSGFPQRFNKELITVYQQLEQYHSKQRPHCINTNKSDSGQNCLVGAQNINSKKGLMIGDSFSNHYWGFVSGLAEESNLSILVQGTSSCITLPGVYLFDWWHFKNQVYQECREQTEKYYHMIQNNHYDYVLIGQVWANYLSPSLINHVGDKGSESLAKERIERALNKALAIISASKATPVLIKSTASMKTNSKECFFKHIKLRQTYNAKQCNFPLVLSEGEQWFDSLFDKMKNKYPKLILIDPKRVQCLNNQCGADIYGIPVFRDVGHLTDYASYQFGIAYLKKYGNPLA